MNINESTVGIKTVDDYTLLTKKVEDTTKDYATYRSVIFGGKNNQLLCVAPPDATNLHDFEEKYTDVSQIYANEAIEGTMINLFFDPEKQTWEIATKTAIGGNYWFFRTNYFEDDRAPVTFRDIFIEAMTQDDPTKYNLQEIPLLDKLAKDHCYSFVVQHPSNHIVLNLSSVAVYLVNVFHLDSVNQTAKWISPLEYENWSVFNTSTVQFPRSYSEKSYQELWDKYCAPDKSNQKNTSVGIMIHHLNSGERTIMRNHNYVELKHIRGNHPNMQYKYLELRRQSQYALNEFLTHFPQYKDTFAMFEEQYDEFVQQLHSAYVSYYIKKSGARISKRLFPMIYRMHHEEFLVYRHIMRKPVVHMFLDKQKITEVMYYINMVEDKEKEEN